MNEINEEPKKSYTDISPTLTKRLADMATAHCWNEPWSHHKASPQVVTPVYAPKSSMPTFITEIWFDM